MQHSPNTPTTGLREHGNDTSKSTGRSGRQKAATRHNMRREEWVTVQGPIKEQQPDGMSYRGWRGHHRRNVLRLHPPFCLAIPRPAHPSHCPCPCHAPPPPSYCTSHETGCMVRGGRVPTGPQTLRGPLVKGGRTRGNNALTTPVHGLPLGPWRCTADSLMVMSGHRSL